MLHTGYKFLASCIAFILAVSLLIASLVFQIDCFEYLISFLNQFEHVEADEIGLATIILLLGGCIDLIRRRKKQQLQLMLEHERLRTLRTTVRTAQDIVGNFLNNLLFYKIKLDKTGVLDKSALLEINQLIQSTSKKLIRLGEVNTVIEKEISKGLFVIDMDTEATDTKTHSERYTPLHSKLTL